MAHIDILALVFIGWLALFGFIKGFLFQLLTAAALIVTIFLAPVVTNLFLSVVGIDSVREGLKLFVLSRLVCGALVYFSLLIVVGLF